MSSDNIRCNVQNKIITGQEEPLKHTSYTSRIYYILLFSVRDSRTFLNKTVQALHIYFQKNPPFSSPDAPHSVVSLPSSLLPSTNP